MDEMEQTDSNKPVDIPDLEERTFDELLMIAMAAANDQNLDFLVKVSEVMARRFPDRAEQYFVLAVVALHLDDEGQAINYLERAHNMDPDCKEYAEALSNIYMRTGRLTDGTFYAKLAVAGESNPLIGNVMPAKLSDLGASMAAVKPSTHFLEASRLYNLRRLGQAVKECSAEIRLNADHFDAYVLLARIHFETHRYGQALGALQAAQRLRPDDVFVAAFIARVLAHQGRHADADALALRAAAGALRELDAEAHGAALDALLCNPVVDKAAVTKLAQDFEDAFFADNPAPEMRESVGTSHNVPRIGFLSNSFYRSDLAERIVPWFNVAVKRAHWIGYQQSVNEDIYTTLLKRGTEEWREIFDLDSFTLAFTLAGEGVDALIDLSVMTGETRFAMSALRPAENRVGVFALTEPGLAPGINFVLSDEILAEADNAWLREGQTCVTMGKSLFTRVPYRYEPVPTPAPVTGNGFVTFAGVIEPKQLSAATAALWADILLKTPKSKLLLILAEEYASEVRDRARELFASLGVADRLQFTLGEDDAGQGEPEEGSEVVIRPDTKVPPAYWSAVDIFLDTSPFNCVEETTEALWSGVPVVTLKGNRRMSLAGASILAAAGRPEWVAGGPDSFVDLAASLAGDADALANARTKLQAEIGKSRLFDGAGIGEEFAVRIGNLAAETFFKRKS